MLGLSVLFLYLKNAVGMTSNFPDLQQEQNRGMAYFLRGQTEEGECSLAILPSWSNFRAQELGISGTAAGHHLFMLASYCLVVKSPRG